MATKLTPQEQYKAKLRKLAQKYRSTVCAGCRYNRYNFESEGDGTDAPTSGEGCFHLERIKRDFCPLKG